MVLGYWPFFPRNRSPTVEFQLTDSVREIEDYTVDLSEVAVLELIIVPDKNGGEARASLRSLRLA